MLNLAAASKRRYALVPTLLSAGVCPNQRLFEMTALMDAAADNDVRMVKLLLTRGADVNACNDMSETAFSYAAANNALAAAKLLRANGAEVNRPDTHGASPLDWAKYTASKEMYDWMRSAHCVHRAESPGWLGQRR